MGYISTIRNADDNLRPFFCHRDISALDPGPPSSLPTDPDAKVDIASLTWEDKERVLRLLFAKINNVQVYEKTLSRKCPPPPSATSRGHIYVRSLPHNMPCIPHIKRIAFYALAMRTQVECDGNPWDAVTNHASCRVLSW